MLSWQTPSEQFSPLGMGIVPPARNFALSPETAVTVGSAKVCATPSRSKACNCAIMAVPPLVQAAGQAALERDAAERDEVMGRFRKKVELLTAALRKVEGVRVLLPAGTFYVFPNVASICMRLGITSHGLAMFLLEGADDRCGVACLGGECFGSAGLGFCVSVARSRTNAWWKPWNSSPRRARARIGSRIISLRIRDIV